MRLRRKLHRWLGILLAIPLIWVCLTGIFLNHGEDFLLGERQVGIPLVLDLYSEFPKEEARGLSVGSRRVYEWGEFVFLDEKLLEAEAPLLGAVALEPDLLILTENKLLLYDAEDELVDEVEHVYFEGGRWKRLGMNGVGEAAILGEKGDYQLNKDTLEFVPIERQGHDFKGGSTPQNIGVAEKAQLKEVLRYETPLSWGRVLLDLHTGRFLGGLGKWLLTFGSLGIVLLTIYGLLLLPKHRHGAKRHKESPKQ